MKKYMVFFRGINVSGHKLIKMDHLTNIFLSSGFENVKTFIQSGNIIFDSKENDARFLSKRLKNIIINSLGYEVDLMVRTHYEINNMVLLDPFKNIAEGKDFKKYITFLDEYFAEPLNLKMFSHTMDVEIIRIEGLNIFSVAYPTKKGRYGFPNAFIEKTLQIKATTRSWNTICKMIQGN